MVVKTMKESPWSTSNHSQALHVAGGGDLDFDLSADRDAAAVHRNGEGEGEGAARRGPQHGQGHQR